MVVGTCGIAPGRRPLGARNTWGESATDVLNWLRGRLARRRARDPRANNPVQLLYQRQIAVLQETRRVVADAILVRRRLESQAEQLRRSREQLAVQARDAVAAGHDDLARDALAADRRTEHQLNSHLQVLVDLRARERRLQASADSLQERAEALRTAIETLTSRDSAADARRRSERGADPQVLIELESVVAATAKLTSDAQTRAAAVDELFASGRIDGVDR